MGIFYPEYPSNFYVSEKKTIDGAQQIDIPACLNPEAWILIAITEDPCLNL